MAACVAANAALVVLGQMTGRYDISIMGVAMGMYCASAGIFLHLTRAK
jgi:hypothetical protein